MLLLYLCSDKILDLKLEDQTVETIYEYIFSNKFF